MVWIHDVSQTALAGAVLILGLVIMLELRSIVRLRRLVDGHLARVFEQLDLLRYENQQLIDAQPPRTPRARGEAGLTLVQAPAGIRSGAAKPVSQDPLREVSAQREVNAQREVTSERGLGTGEQRLLASMVAARAKLERPPSATAGR